MGVTPNGGENCQASRQPTREEEEECWERRFRTPPACRLETPQLPAGNIRQCEVDPLPQHRVRGGHFPSRGQVDPARGENSPAKKGADFTAPPSFVAQQGGRARKIG